MGQQEMKPRPSPLRIDNSRNKGCFAGDWGDYTYGCSVAGFHLDEKEMAWLIRWLQDMLIWRREHREYVESYLARIRYASQCASMDGYERLYRMALEAAESGALEDYRGDEEDDDEEELVTT